MKSTGCLVVTGMVGSSLLAAGCDFVGVPCGGITALLCGETFYCQYDEGTCGDGDQTGVCAPRPEVCAEIYAPVCGCDGQTYENACSAAGAGVSIRRQGTCPVDGDSICGGIAGFICGEGELCKFDLGTCGAADQSGVCIAVPDVCTTVVDEVCGCDDVTYTNECEAERAGTSVVSRGACAGGGDQQICGGIAGFPCDEGEYCQTNIGECCCDFLGVCIVVPDVCTEEFAPVCGCNGVTYDNLCFAARAGASIDYEGACGPG